MLSKNHFQAMQSMKRKSTSTNVFSWGRAFQKYIILYFILKYKNIFFCKALPKMNTVAYVEFVVLDYFVQNWFFDNIDFYFGPSGTMKKIKHPLKQIQKSTNRNARQKFPPVSSLFQIAPLQWKGGIIQRGTIQIAICQCYC